MAPLTEDEALASLFRGVDEVGRFFGEPRDGVLGRASSLFRSFCCASKSLREAAGNAVRSGSSMAWYFSPSLMVYFRPSASEDGPAFAIKGEDVSGTGLLLKSAILLPVSRDEERCTLRFGRTISDFTNSALGVVIGRCPATALEVLYDACPRERGKGCIGLAVETHAEDP